MAQAGFKAGLGWAGGQWSTRGLEGEALAEARDRLTYEQALAWVTELGKLKGSVVKLGQIMATYGDHCLPPPVALALHQLEADTAPLAWSVIKTALQEALGERLASLIVEPVPLAAASLAQVHRARVKSDNRSLCLKVLYPGVINTVDSDLAVLSAGLRWWLHGENKTAFEQWLIVIRSVLAEELDLVSEANKLMRWHDRLSTDSRYVVPAVDLTFCTSSVLAMQFEHGVSLHDEQIAALSQTRRNALAQSMLELLLREVLEWGEMQTDPHPGNYRIRVQANESDQLVLLDFGSVRTIAPALLQPLQQMVLAAWQRNEADLSAAIVAAGLLDHHVEEEVKHAFVAVLMGLMEPLHYRDATGAVRPEVPSYAVDDAGNYLWKHANLPKRMGKQALHSAFSPYFAFPGADFLLLSRKLAGVYAFIAALDARFDGSVVMQRVVNSLHQSDAP